MPTERWQQYHQVKTEKSDDDYEWPWLYYADEYIAFEVDHHLNNHMLQSKWQNDIDINTFNISILDLPTTVSRKYAYADNLAIMHADGDWQAVEGVLSKDMATIDENLRTWKLKLSTTETVSEVFHLNNKEAKRELKVSHNNETLPFCSKRKYLGVTLDRSLIYHQHLESLHIKLTCVALLSTLLGCWSNNITNSWPP